MKWGIFVIFVMIPNKLPSNAVEIIKKGNSIVGRWKIGFNPKMSPPRKGNKISLIVPITIEPTIPINNAKRIFFLYL